MYHQSIADILDADGEYDHLVRLNFEAEWGDPLESEHTDLDEVPTEACIDFGNGIVRDCSMAFIVKRAMIDPDATVHPTDG